MDIIYGINPVIELLRHESTSARKIIIARGRTGSDVKTIAELARKHNIPILYEDRNMLDGMTATASNQGVAALCRPYQYRSVDALIANIANGMKNSLIVLLDNITDPQNLGSIIRTAHCFGANGVIIPKNRAAEVSPAVIKASAGAANHTPVAIVTNLASTIKYLKEKGFWVYGADACLGVDISDCQKQGNVVLVMGSEGSGIRPLVKKSCDFLISIPLYGKVDSLNVSVAAGIILHEIRTAWRREV